eukprot:PhF_6_TR31528/c0_g1_i1/m.46479/K18752/TNPO1, IPO2, KPNB2; transportin-1
MSNFQPDSGKLDFLCGVISRAASGNDGGRTALSQLESMYGNQETFTYLAYIFTELRDNMNMRLLCGATLRAQLRPNGACDPRNPDLQILVLKALEDNELEIRKYSASLVSTITTNGGLQCWNIDIINHLCTTMENPRNTACGDGSLRALSMLLQDYVESFSPDMLNRILQNIIRFVSGDDEYTMLALEGIAAVVFTASEHEQGSPVIMVVERSAESILRKLEVLIQCQARHPTIQRYMCQLFVTLLRYPTEFMRQMLPNVAEWMLVRSTDRNEEVAMEAIEFWSELCNLQIGGNMLYDMLPRLVPVLLDAMCYSETELGMIMSVPDDCSVPDPQTGVHKRHTEEEGGDEEEEEDEDDEVKQYTAREAAMGALDDIANTFADAMLQGLLELVNQRMQPGAPWKVQESAIMSMGCIAEGCMGGMREHMPSLLPRLVTLSESADVHILVRQTTMYTLSRYSPFICDERPREFKSFVQFLVKQMHSNSKTIQGAATSALVELLGCAKPEMINNFLKDLIPPLTHAYTIFQVNNTRALFEVIIVLCQKCKSDLLPFTRDIVMPLQHKWQLVNDDNPFIYSLFRVLSAVFIAVGSELGALVSDVVSRCVRILQKHCALRNQAISNREEPPEPEYIIHSADLLASQFQSCPQQAANCLESYGGTIIDLMRTFGNDRASEIRQAAIAVIGELISAYPDNMRNLVPQFVDMCLHNLNDPSQSNASANAAWCLGVTASKCGLPNIPAVAQALVTTLQRANKRSLQNQCAIALGHVCGCGPDECAPNLQGFFRQWCMRLRGVMNDSEKVNSICGMCRAIGKNPQAVLNDLTGLIDVIVSCNRDMDDEGYVVMRDTIQNFKGGYPDVWGRTWNTVRSANPGVASFLSDVYGV